MYTMIIETIKKNRRLIIMSIVIIFIVGSFISIKVKLENPIYVSKKISELDITDDFKLLTFKENWFPNGDGERLIIYSVPSHLKQSLLFNLNQKRYRKMPIRDIPDVSIHKIIPITDTLGYFKITFNVNDARDYDLTVIDLNKNRLIVYSNYN